MLLWWTREVDESVWSSNGAVLRLLISSGQLCLAVCCLAVCEGNSSSVGYLMADVSRSFSFILVPALAKSRVYGL